MELAENAVELSITGGNFAADPTLAVMAAKLPPVIESKVTLQLLPIKKVREIVPLRDYMDTNTTTRIYLSEPHLSNHASPRVVHGCCCRRHRHSRFFPL